jgi:hypothetical protein
MSGPVKLGRETKTLRMNYGAARNIFTCMTGGKQNADF